MTSKPTDDESLYWQACQYVQGDLSAADEEAFEGLLAADQAAREAVAFAAEMQNAIHAACVWEAAESTRVAVPRRRMMLASGAVGGVLAASALLVLATINNGHSESQSRIAAVDGPPVVQQQASSELALLWAHQLEAEPAMLTPVDEVEQLEQVEEVASWEGDGVDPTDWMWLAISEEGQPRDEDSPESSDEGAFDEPQEESL